MLLLVVYCGFIFSFVSSTDKQTSKKTININTALPTMSNLSPNAITGSKPCILEMKDSEMSKIVELFNNDLVHVVDISVSLSNVSHGKELLYDFHVQLMKPIGREILFALDQYKLFQWTLTVGVRDFELNLLESQNGCIRNRTNVTEFVWETVQNIVRTINFTRKYHVWYSYNEISSEKVRKGCCKIVKPSLVECNDSCFEIPILFQFEFLLVPYMIIVSCHLLFNALLSSRIRFFYAKSPKCYKWVRKESKVGNRYLYFEIYTFSLVFWFTLFCPFWILVSLPLKVLLIVVFAIHCFFSVECTFILMLLQELESSEMVAVSSVRRIASKSLQHKFETFAGKHLRSNNRVLKFLDRCICDFVEVLMYFLSYYIVFPCDIIVVVLRLFHSVHLYISTSPNWLKTFFDFFISVFPSSCMLLMNIATMPLLLGLFFNLIFFLPFLAFSSALTFHCINCWKSMQDNYLVLKQLIYEEIRDTERDEGNFKPSKPPKRNEEVLPVVSKELYDKIREKLLPYNENLFYFGVKMLCAFAFTFAIFLLIKMLRELELTGFVQVLTTVCLSAMPHIFNVVVLKSSEELETARQEMLKLNVKYMVEKLVRENSELARTGAKTISSDLGSYIKNVTRQMK